VSDALVARERLEEIRDQQAREVKSLDRAVRVSTDRYVAGRASYYEVLEAQQQLFPAELSLARTHRDQELAVVALYKALGGGGMRNQIRNLKMRIRTKLMPSFALERLSSIGSPQLHKNVWSLDT
jgi:outer membrane protein TolC